MQDRYSRNKYLWLTLAILLSVVIVGSGLWFFLKKTENRSGKKCEHCNIMMIDIDILRGDELPCLGYFRPTTPNICKFAMKGVVFKDNYSTSYWTFPSIFSTMTSLYPTFHGMQISLTDKLSPKIPTLAETLKKEGYRTVFIGKGEDLPNAQNGGLRGFDEVTSDQVDKVLSDLSKSSQPWFIYYFNPDLHAPYYLNKGDTPMENLTAPKNLPTNEADFLKLLNIYLKKHYKEVFKQEAIDKFGSIILGPDKENDTSLANLFVSLYSDKKEMVNYLNDVWESILETYLESFDKNNPADVAYVKMLYDTRIRMVDKKIESLLQNLNSKPLVEKTITVITSDHGENFGEHGLFSHSPDYHSELFYTPLIIRAPQLTNKEIRQTTSLVDIFPTLLDLTGIKKPEGLQGESLLPYINGQYETKRPYAISEYKGNIILHNHDWLYYLPNNANSLSESELYNRNDDPEEKINVLMKYPEMSKYYYEKANLFRSYNIFYEKKPAVESEILKDIDPNKLKRLREEGYF